MFVTDFILSLFKTETIEEKKERIKQLEAELESSDEETENVDDENAKIEVTEDGPYFKSEGIVTDMNEQHVLVNDIHVVLMKDININIREQIEKGNRVIYIAERLLDGNSKIQRIDELADSNWGDQQVGCCRFFARKFIFFIFSAFRGS